MVPVADQKYEIWNCASFCYIIIRGKSKLRINTKHSLLKINLHEQQACTFVTLISVAPPLDPKTFDKRRILSKCSKRRYSKKKLDQRLGCL